MSLVYYEKVMFVYCMTCVLYDTRDIFSLKIRIDSCYRGLPWDHWAEQILFKPWKKQKRTYLSLFIQYT